jgi:hypothetical protein
MAEWAGLSAVPAGGRWYQGDSRDRCAVKIYGTHGPADQSPEPAGGVSEAPPAFSAADVVGTVLAAG